MNRYLVVPLLMIGSFSSPVSAAVIDVFFMAGQSNMSGRASSGYVVDPRDSQVSYYYRSDGPPANNETSGGSCLFWNGIFLTIGIC